MQYKVSDLRGKSTRYAGIYKIKMYIVRMRTHFYA